MRILITCLFAFVLLATPAEAQIGGFLKKHKERAEERAKAKAEEDADNTNDNAVDKAYDTVKEGFKGLFKKKKKNKETTEELEEDDMMEEGEENIEAETDEESELNTEAVEISSSTLTYTPSPYICSFMMTTEMYKKGKLRKNGMIQTQFVIDTDKSAFLTTIDGNHAKNLFFPAKKKMYMYAGTGDMIIAMKMKKYKIKMKVEGFKITKTEEFKTIDGYPCRKYIAESSEQLSTVWVTESIDVDMTKLMSNFGYNYNVKNSPYGIGGEQIKGFPVLVETLSKDGKEKVVQRYSKIVFDNIDRSVFDLSKYKVIGF